MISATTGAHMAQALLHHRVDTVFGIPGVQTYDLTDAIAQCGDRLRFIVSRHEQGAGYMAYGYAKSSGRPGVFTVVPGPGVLNAGAALCTAYGANAPVLCLTGNIMADFIGRGRGQLHELPDQLALLRGLTKGADRITHPSEAPARMAEAFRLMRSGRPGPVAVEAPWDIFGLSGAAPDPFELPVAVQPPDPEQIVEAARLIAAAKNPMIAVGGGAVEAGAEILALAQRIGAPVVAHRSGKGVVAEDGAHALDIVAAYDYWRDCDLLIGIGSRLELQFMRWPWRPPGLKIIRIDVDPTEFGRVKPTLGLVSDATLGVAALNAELADAPKKADRVAEFAALRARARVKTDAIEPQASYLKAIRAALPRDGFFVEEISQMGFVARLAFPVYAPRHYVASGYQENLGFGFNTALGVKVANPGKPVVSISGDGGFLFGAQELATAVQHNIAVVSVVFNNSGFGNVRRDQITRYDGRRIGSDLHNPDFVALATSFGVMAERVETPAALQAAITRALAAGVPALIEAQIPTGSETSPWPLYHPAPPERK